MERLAPGELERVVQRWTQPRCKRPEAVAADGKRIRGTNRLTPEGTHCETVTLADYATGIPLASRGRCKEGGEPATMRGLLEEIDVRGPVVTLDAGPAGLAAEAALADRRGADWLQMIQGNCKATLARLVAGGWSRGRRYVQRWRRSRGRWEKRVIEVVHLEPGELALRHARQAIRVTHRTREAKDSPVTEEVLHGIMSLTRALAGARRLLTLQRGRRAAENANRFSRDAVFREDAGRIRTGNGPLANAAPSHLALAIARRRGKEFDTVPQARIHFAVRREDALAAILRPTRTTGRRPDIAARGAAGRSLERRPGGSRSKGPGGETAGSRLLPGEPARARRTGRYRRRCTSSRADSAAARVQAPTRPRTRPAWRRPTDEKEPTLPSGDA